MRKQELLSYGDKASLLMMLISGTYLIIDSGIHLLLGERFYILTFAAGTGVLYASYRFYAMTFSPPVKPDSSGITTSGMENIMAAVEASRTEHFEILKRLKEIDRATRCTAFQGATENLPPGSVHSITMLFRYNLLVTMTLAFYIFVVFFPQWYTFYLSLITFILWWALITYHHDLWRAPEAWYWLTVPFLIIPLFIFIFTALYPVTIMFGFLFILLIAYSFLYYTWCEHAVTGIVPFGIGTRIEAIRDMLRKKEPEAK